MTSPAPFPFPAELIEALAREQAPWLDESMTAYQLALLEKLVLERAKAIRKAEGIVPREGS